MKASAYQRSVAKRTQTGVAWIWMIAGIATLAAAFAAYLNATSSGLTATTANQPNKLGAGGMVSQGAILLAAMNEMSSRVTASTITFDTSASTGLFNPTIGGTSYVRPDPALFVGAPVAVPAARQAWVYKPNVFTANNVGTAAADSAFVLRGISQKACEEANRIVSSSATIPALGKSASTFVADAATDAVNPITDTTASDVSGAAGIARWTQGCGQTSDNEYVYFVVAAQL